MKPLRGEKPSGRFSPGDYALERRATLLKKRRVWAASPYYLIITAAMVVMTFISYFTASRSVFYLFAALTLVSGGVVLITVIRFRS